MKTNNNKKNWSGRRTLVALFAGMVIPATPSAQDANTFEYRIGSNDTLGTLAEKIESFGGSHNQRRRLIQDSNPHIFIDGDPNQLRFGALVSLQGQGAVSSAPTAAQVVSQSVTPQDQRNETQSAAASTNTVAGANTGDFEYRIQQGDTLSTLAEKIESFGGSHYQRRKLIQESNPQIFINNDLDQLRVGSVVKLGQQPTAVASSSKAAPAAPSLPPADAKLNSAATFEYRIKNGDTLSGLAEKIESFGGSHYERRKLIQDSNPHIFLNGDRDQLRVGSVMELVNKQATTLATNTVVGSTQAVATAPAAENAPEPEPEVLNTNPAAIKNETKPKKKSYLDKLVMSPQAKLSEYDGRVFGPDPDYGDDIYNAEAQKAIYGGKRAVFTPRPLLELGRPQYQNGPLTRTTSIIGDRNQIAPALAVYGDLRTAVALNDNGGVENDLLAARLNLDIDLKLTGTERLHAFVRPLDKNNEFTRISVNDDVDDDEFILDGNLETLFFEGDLGAIAGGIADVPSSFDLPFAVGLMPLLFQNGVWLEDAFTGLAVTIPARNSRRFDISNFDITFFAGFDKVSSQAIRDEFGQVADDNVNVYGIASFWELLRGYAEVDYAFIDGRDEFDQFDHHNFSVSFSKRFRDIASSSFRIISTFGQDLEGTEKTAGGTLLLWENSLITSRPSTFIPYMNFFAGFDRPQSVARDNGGLLKTVGINFESDALTGYPLLDDTGQDVFGGAIGIQNLFSLDQQLVVELAGVKLMDDDAPLGKAKGDQLALGIRYQRPLSRAWLIRADAIKGWLENDDNIDGIRFEIRRKF